MNKKYTGTVPGAVLCTLLLAVFTGCSSVFSSTVTGTVQEQTDSDTAVVSGVSVYAFISQSERDSAVSGGSVPSTSVSIFYGTTNSNGIYTIPIEWETFSAAFGKTADRIPVYLAFYHKDFGSGKLTAATTVSWLTSDNSCTMNTETLTRTSDSYTLNFDIRNVALTTGYTVNASNFTVKVTNSDASATYYTGTPSENSVTFSGETGGVTGYVTITPNDTNAYVQCSSDGTYASAYSTKFTLAGKNATNTADTQYVKSLVMASVNITGTVQASGKTDITCNGYKVTLLDSSSTTTYATCTSATRSVTDNYQQYGYFTLAAPEVQLTAGTYGTGKTASVTYTVTAAGSVTISNSPLTVTVTNDTSKSGDYTDIVLK